MHCSVEKQKHNLMFQSKHRLCFSLPYNEKCSNDSCSDVSTSTILLLCTYNELYIRPFHHLLSYFIIKDLLPLAYKNNVVILLNAHIASSLSNTQYALDQLIKTNTLKCIQSYKKSFGEEVYCAILLNSQL